MATTPDPITQLVRQCDPNERLSAIENERLSAIDQRFVDFSEARGTDVLKVIERQLRRAGEVSERLLFAGHLGIGKAASCNDCRHDSKAKQTRAVASSWCGLIPQSSLIPTISTFPICWS